MKILGIDPGSTESAFVVLDDLKPTSSGKVKNDELLLRIYGGEFTHCIPAIECIASYGMSVGATVFETCIWVGRFMEAFRNCYSVEPNRIYRKDEKMNLCGSMKAKDANIRQALIDRFGEVGTKKEPGWFYGFKSDIWAACAVAVTYYDVYVKGADKDDA